MLKPKMVNRYVNKVRVIHLSKKVDFLTNLHEKDIIIIHVCCSITFTIRINLKRKVNKTSPRVCSRYFHWLEECKLCQ